MKPSILFVYSLLLCLTMPALAMDANGCVAESTRLEMSERDAYIKSCLAQVSSPENVKKTELQQKKALCEQNARNHKLQGNEKANYLETCMNKNEAEAAAAAKGITPQATAKVEDNQEKNKKKAAKPVPAKNRSDAKDKSKAKPKNKAKDAKAVRDGKRETAE